MPGLFDPPTGPADAVRPQSYGAGTPEAEDALFASAARRLKPHYESSRRATEQSFADRGLFDSGQYQQGQGNLREAYLSDLMGLSENASRYGSDLRENKRQRAEARGWQVEDRDLMLAERRDADAKAEDQANKAMWSDIISKGAQAVGTYYGGALGGTAAKAGADKLLPQYETDYSEPMFSYNPQDVGYRLERQY